MKNINKTPLQELIEWCESFKDYPCRPTVDNMKEKAYQLMQKEKQLIIDSFKYGQIDSVGTDDCDNNNSEKYYNDKFK